jgi:hypothetical protein
MLLDHAASVAQAIRASKSQARANQMETYWFFPTPKLPRKIKTAWQKRRPPASKGSSF